MTSDPLNAFWHEPPTSVQKGDYQMAFYQPMNMSHVNFPDWHWHTPQFMSQMKAPFHSISALKPGISSTTPHPINATFDVRETDDAYYLDGDFPGVDSKDDIKMQWTGKRTLLVEANLNAVDIVKEWDIIPREPTEKPTVEAEKKEVKTEPSKEEQEKQHAMAAVVAAADIGAHMDDSVIEEEKAEGEADEDDLTLHRCLTSQDPPAPKEEVEEAGEHSTSRRSSRSSQSSRSESHSKAAAAAVASGPRRSSITASLKKRLSFGTASTKRPTLSPRSSTTAAPSLKHTTSASTAAAPAGERPPYRTLSHERRIGHVKRIFTFSEDVDHDSLRARLAQGLLKVKVDKVEPMSPKPVEIELYPCYFAM